MRECCRCAKFDMAGWNEFSQERGIHIYHPPSIRIQPIRMKRALLLYLLLHTANITGSRYIVLSYYSLAS